MDKEGVARLRTDGFRRLGSRDPLADPGPLIRRVYAYIAYRVDDASAADEITSRTFERAVRYRTSYDPAKGSPLAWVIGIANRCLSDRVPAATVPLDEAPDPVAPGDLEEGTVVRVELARALATLDERSRTLVALRYAADMTARQIADILEMTPHAVEVALGRALARLERRLDLAPGRGRLDPGSAQAAELR
jgi:RNA polymerase sigma-70 factor, ECF subfamily